MVGSIHVDSDHWAYCSTHPAHSFFEAPCEPRRIHVTILVVQVRRMPMMVCSTIIIPAQVRSRVPTMPQTTSFSSFSRCSCVSRSTPKNKTPRAFIEARVGCSSDSLESEPNITEPNSACQLPPFNVQPKKHLPGSTQSKNETSSVSSLFQGG